MMHTLLLSTLLTGHFRNEREKYAKHRHKAEHNPNKYLSLIIDGMDQDKTDVPHIISNPKALAGNYTLETHVTGVKVHGRRVFMAVDCGQFSHDSNLTLEVLLRVFMEFKVSYIVLLYYNVNYHTLCRILCHLLSTFKWITHVEIIKISTF